MGYYEYGNVLSGSVSGRKLLNHSNFRVLTSSLCKYLPVYMAVAFQQTSLILPDILIGGGFFFWLTDKPLISEQKFALRHYLI